MKQTFSKPTRIECMIPTVGVYPIATANDRNQISAPLMSRFAVIEIPDYTPEEKKIIFSRYALPKVLKRIGMKEKECILTPVLCKKHPTLHYYFDTRFYVNFIHIVVV